ncbi:threonine/homoserine/homoserine lactone efflux protein [Maribacter vaceletii]|uniref:Threonine/homoserine/homoserine lactone efflux protein n=1 Tax=Maribacter vaceletii TaxID=1206816 RepID=A0A495ED55_9FLAO|nr:LysE family transporter [Maribacter vaceletii]RKR14818.1 threonine/homoserine/homoserine lactone efflux protein [Maribacter vaceletii]
MLEDIQAAIPLGFLLSFMIGPVFFVLLETSAIKGFRAAIVFNLGVIIADILFITIAYFSSFQLLENLSNEPGLYVFGGVILVIYGITSIVKKEAKKEETIKVSSGHYISLFVKGFLLNFINIGVLVFWLGIIIVVGPSLDNESNRIVVFFSAVLLTYFIVDIFKILLAKQLKRKLTFERIRLVKKFLGVVLVICGLVLIIKGFLPKDKFTIEEGIEKMEQIRE